MDTSGTLTFLAANSEPPTYHASTGGRAAELRLAGNFEDREVLISDMRLQSQAGRLDVEGFACLQAPTALLNLYDDQVRAHSYEPACRELLTTTTGARRVHIFDHTFRSSDPDQRDAHKSREPASVVHNDYTPRSAARRVRDLLPESADVLLQAEFAIVNIWRPLRPVENFAMALCDARTLREEDLVPSERRSAERLGELSLVRYSQRQRWAYYPGMQVPEVLLIKTFDSRTDRSRQCVHSAFNDHRAEPGALPRESVETRAFCFFG